jgi:cell division protein FtsL
MNNVQIGARPVPVPEGRGLADALRLMLYIFLLFLPLLLYVALSVQQVSEEYRISKLVKERQRVIQEHNHLLLQREALLNSARVDEAARTLAMVREAPDEPVLDGREP